MRHEIPTTDEILALVEANPGFMVLDHVNALDWGDLGQYENHMARERYRQGVVNRLSKLVRQGYLVREDTKPSKFYVREEIAPRGMKGHIIKIYVEFDGRTVPLVDLCRKYGIRRSTAYARLRRGWSVEETLMTPPDKHRRHKRGN